MTILSLAHASVLDASPLELIELAAAAGFHAYGPRIAPPMPSDKIIEVIGDKNLQREMKARAEDLGIIALDIEAFWLTEHSDVESLRPALETGSFLGAQNLLVVGNDPDQARLDDNFSRLAIMANSYGIRTMLEFMAYSAIPTVKESAALLRRTEPANAGILIDALHLSRTGETPADLANYPAEWFSYLHLCDAAGPVPALENLRTEARTARLLPGDGDLPLVELVRALPKGTALVAEVPSAYYNNLSYGEKVKAMIEKTRQIMFAAFPDTSRE